MEKKKNSLLGSLMLLVTAIIWGFAFVAQSVGIDKLGCFSFNGIRSIIGAVVLIPVILVIKKINGGERMFTKEAIIGGICCGVVLFVASSFQQFGIKYSTVGKASFITALYVVIVPLLGLFVKKRPSTKTWVGVGTAVIGLYLLCFKPGSFSIGKGDALLLVCSLLFSIHILVIDYFSPKANGVVISCIQFFVSGIMACVAMFIFENPQLPDIMECWLPILYAGIGSCGIAYTLQIVFQKGVDPTAASLILCTESLFGAIGGWILLGQTLSIREIGGCSLMLVAIVLAQL